MARRRGERGQDLGGARWKESPAESGPERGRTPPISHTASLNECRYSITCKLPLGWHSFQFHNWRARPARPLHRVRRRRDGARGLGRGRPGWFVQDYRSARQRTLSVLGQNTSRTAPVRSKRVIASPLRGFGRNLLKDTSIRRARPVRANTGAGSRRDVRNQSAVGS
jgi:hypothetical protein